MASYNYKSGKKRIVEILNNKLEVFEKDKLPKENDFTFDNAYESWITSIFVDIRQSSELFSNEDKEEMSKIIRSFTSEVIEILRLEDNLREIGIRGDCVYAIYTTQYQFDIYTILDLSFQVNTFMIMLNNLLSEKGFQKIYVGIGLSTAKELVVKAGRKGTGINNMVWIGEAVTKASNLSSLGNKNGYRSIVLSSLTYSNSIDILVKRSGEKAKKWFTEHYDYTYKTHYDANIIKTDFNEWIEGGMKDE